MARLILPKSLVYLRPRDIVFFLAGPILGGGDWQSEAVLQIAEKIPKAYIVCPARWDAGHHLFQFSLPGESAEMWERRGLPRFPRQTHWERYYLERAGRADQKGAILFWLPKEDPQNPRPPETGPYARGTYGELGEWRWRMRTEKARVFIGAEYGFPGLSVIEANYRAVLGEMFTPYPTLDATIDAALKLAREEKKGK